jgi:uncharacterized membrane protein
MRWVLIVVGIVLILIGVGWALQGGSVLPYGQMAGQSRWIYLGIALAAVGVVLLVLGLRLKARKRSR